MHGIGKIVHTTTGNVWAGEFIHDRKEGKGLALKSSDGGLYKGLWKHGER